MTTNGTSHTPRFGIQQVESIPRRDTKDEGSKQPLVKTLDLTSQKNSNLAGTCVWIKAENNCSSACNNASML